MSTHLIKKGDTLSGLAKRYNIDDVEMLRSLNAEQIKDIDLIYDGNTLVISEPLDLSGLRREQKKTLSTDHLQSTQCSAGPVYVDGLFIPEHPTSKKQKMLLLSAEAKTLIESEAGVLNSAVTGNKNDVLKGLATLGLLDPFNSLAHESFLLKESKATADLYKKALLQHKAINDNYSRGYKNIPAKMDELAIVNDAKIGLGSAKDDFDDIRKNYNYKIELINDNHKHIGIGGFNLEEALLDNKKEYIRKFKRFQKSCIEKLKEQIDGFESKAQGIARKTKIEDGEHHYQYVVSKGYYSSDVQAAIYRELNKLNGLRAKMHLDDGLSSKTLTESSNILDLKEAHKAYKAWEEVVEASRNDPVLALPSASYAASYRRGDGLDFNAVNFNVSMSYLNKNNMVFREQCLTEGQLFAGFDKVEEIRSSIKNKSLDISKLDNYISEQISSIDTFGYYSAYVLELLLVQEVSVRIKDFTRLVGGNVNYGGYVGKILAHANKAKARCDALKAMAEDAKNTPFGTYTKIDINFVGPLEVDTSVANELIWDEKQWVPQDFSNHIYADNGKNQRFVVECMLSSAPSNVLYILSDCPVLFSDNKEHCHHTKEIKLPTPSTISNATNSLEDALKSALGKGTQFELGVQALGMSSSASLTEIADAVLPWRIEETNALGLPASIETSGGAQFFRFVSSSGGGAKFAKALTNKNAEISISGGGEKGIVFASGGIDFSLKFPPDKAKKYELDVPYYTKESEEIKTKNIGSGQLIINAKVYGVAAASIALSSGITFGHTTAGDLGVGGVNNVFVDSSAHDAGAPVVGGEEKKELVASATMEAKAFAGVEVGGSVECLFDWYPTKQVTKPIQLLKVASGLKCTFGASYAFLFQCSFYKGRFIFKTDVGGALGLGFSGQFATELNTVAADDFFGMLLDITHEPGFSRFGFFDEEGDSVTFAIFNHVLTAAAIYGLGISEVLLLPYKIIASMAREADDEKNAFFVANFIASDVYIKKNEKWVKNMPAETLSKLLKVLINYNEMPILASSNMAKMEERKNAFAHNQKQREAILNILTWIAGDSGSVNEQQTRRFTNTLQRMGVKYPSEQDDAKKWQRYADNAMALRKFFVDARKDEYTDLDEKFDTKLRPGEYMAKLEVDLRLFLDLMGKLTEKTPVYERVFVQRRQGVMERYTTNQTGQSSLDGYKRVEWTYKLDV